jgi:DNA-binding NtrC family response regulator
MLAQQTIGSQQGAGHNSPVPGARAQDGASGAAAAHSGAVPEVSPAPGGRVESAPREAQGPFVAASESPVPVSRAMCRKVLVVEDGRRLREMLVDAIRLMGLEPEGAPTAEVAAEMLQHTVFTTAVLDLNLPHMGGLELAETIRQQWPDVQIIILTAFGNLDAAKRAIRLDVVDFLTKPCGMSDLEIALSRARLRWMERCAPEDHVVRQEPRASSVVVEVPTPKAGMSMEEMERQAIMAALARNAGSREAAAAELGISVRKLYYRLQQYQKSSNRLAGRDRLET